MRTKMNKYQVALDYIKHDLEHNDFIRYKNGNHVDKYHRDILQELVDKATPMKPKSFNDLRECCLCSCGYDFYDWGYNEYKYCPNCGKKVDWSEDE